MQANRCSSILAILAIVAATAASLAAPPDNWQAIVLGQAGYNSWAYAAAGGMQAGRLGSRAVLWHGTNQHSYLPATGYVESEVRAIGTQGYFGTGTIQVGSGFRGRAVLWETAIASPVELLPLGAIHSWAHGASGSQLVGQVRFDAPNDQDRAALWDGPSHEFVDLHPSGASRSAAFATDGVMQGGEVIMNSVGHAALWSGSASGWVSLNPPGSTNAEIRAMAPGVQVGKARPAGHTASDAALWRGTAASYINMNPTAALHSELHGNNGQFHVGHAWFASLPDALLWFDDEPDSYINLHSLLPPGFAGSTANSVSVVGDTVYVTGIAAGQGQRAVVWIGTIPAPSAGAAVLVGMGLLAARRRR